MPQLSQNVISHFRRHGYCFPNPGIGGAGVFLQESNGFTDEIVTPVVGLVSNIRCELAAMEDALTRIESDYQSPAFAI